MTSGLLSKRWESDNDAPWRGAGYYYVGVGGIEKKLYKSAGERVPEGLECRAYYSPGSKRLLSLEVATAGSAPVDFVDASAVWARIRWRGVATILGFFMLIAGAADVATGNPAQRFGTSVAGFTLILVGCVSALMGVGRLLPWKRRAN